MCAAKARSVTFSRACRLPRQHYWEQLQAPSVLHDIVAAHYAAVMTSIDFAAAEQRAVDRRAARAAQLRSRHQHQSSEYALRASNRFPYPFNKWSQAGIEAWDTIKGREGTRPAFRVGQVDAELLDEELLELLRNQIGEALKYFGSHLRDDWSSEILLGLRAVLFKLSIWDHDASYGAALQNLRYTDARHEGPVAKAPTGWQKACYGLLSVGGRYGWEKWDIWLADQEGSYEGVSLAHGLTSNLLICRSQRLGCESSHGCRLSYPPPIQSPQSLLSSSS